VGYVPGDYPALTVHVFIWAYWIPRWAEDERDGERQRGRERWEEGERGERWEEAERRREMGRGREGREMRRGRDGRE
jgi:hypothetical protein